MADWKVDPKKQRKRDKKQVKILIEENLDANMRGKKGVNIERIKFLTDQDSSHRTPYTEHRFNKRFKKDVNTLNDFYKEMDKQKRKK